MINSIHIDNINIINYILNNNTKLKDIKLVDNNLIYNKYSINIDKLNLNILFVDKYSKLVVDIKNDNIYPEDFMEIMIINSYEIEDDYKSITDYALSELTDDNNTIISFNHFEKLLNSNVLSEIDFKKISRFQKYIKLLLLQTNNDDTYLNDKQKQLLDNYLDLMQNMLQNNNHNNASDNYIKIIEDVNQEKNKRLKKYLSLEKKDGYINALFIIFVMTITGIIIGLCGMTLK